MKWFLFFLLLVFGGCSPDKDSVSKRNDSKANKKSPSNVTSTSSENELPPEEIQTKWVSCGCLKNGVPIRNTWLNQQVSVVMVVERRVAGKIEVKNTYNQEEVNKKCQDRVKKEVKSYGSGHINPSDFSLEEVMSEDVEKCEKGTWGPNPNDEENIPK